MEGSRDLDAQVLRKGRRRRRWSVKEEKEPSLLSFKGGREGTVFEMSPLMRRFENARYSTHYARSPHRFASPTAGAPHVCSLCIFTWSSDRALTHAVEGPTASGGPWPFAPSRGHVCGLGSRGLLSVFWIPRYPGPPAPGPLQRPSFGPGVER
jgi:hypothetical protein